MFSATKTKTLFLYQVKGLYTLEKNAEKFPPVTSASYTYNQLLVALKQMFLYSIQAGLPA